MASLVKQSFSRSPALAKGAVSFPAKIGKAAVAAMIAAAVGSYAPLASPTFTGTPLAPTATLGTNTTQIATTAFVQAAIAALVNSSPAALDTLNELAAALGNDASFSTTVTNSLALKAPLASPTFTGANGAVAVTIDGGTQTGGSFPALSVTQTWNNAATTFTAHKVNVTRTASTTSSLVLDYQVGGVSVFNCDLFGRAALAGSFAQLSLNGANATTALTFTASQGITWGGNANFMSPAAATFQFGFSDAAAPVAQSMQAQSVVAGTSNTAGVDWTFKGSKGTGTGVGGGFVWQIAKAGTTGTAQNALTNGLKLTGSGSLVIGAAALTTTATDGFLYIPTSAGAPTGVPTAQTGTVALQYDTTNNKLYVYNGAWKSVTLA